MGESGESEAITHYSVNYPRPEAGSLQLTRKSRRVRMVDGSAQVDGVRLVAAVNVLKHHFWIGEEEGEALREVV